ncbi:MAG: ABC transporter substrate-binding protein [Gaiellaceae bacterium]
MKRVVTPIRAICVAAALAAAVAGGAASTAGSAAAAAAGARAAVPDTFTYASVSQVMVGWDPSTAYSNEVIAMSNMYETLTRYDSATHKAVPLLAKSFSSSNGGKTWTFQLRRGITFHTGRPLDAAAAKAAIERTIKLNQGAAYIWGSVKSIATPTPYTLVFHLKYPSPLDLNASADYAAYIFDTKAAGPTDLGKWFAAGHDAGTGPYTVQTWNKGQEIELRLQAYPKYWRGWIGPHYKRVVFRVVPSATTTAQLLRAQEVSFVERMTPQLWASFKNTPGIATTARSSWQNALAMLNTQSGPLANRTVRQAVDLGIDYSGILAALKGAAVRQVGIVPPGLWGSSRSLPNSTSDSAKAKALLKSAGYGPGGKKITLLLTHVQGDADEELVSTLIKSELAPLNIDVNVQAMAWPVQWAKAKSANKAARQDILLFYWWPDYADPYSWFINLFKTGNPPFFNLAYYSNKKLDAMMNRAEPLAATNRPAAVKLYQQMQATLMNDAPVAPLYTQVYQRAMLSSVHGFVDNPAYPNVVFVYDTRPGAA